MRLALLTMFMMAVAGAGQTAKADPYRWCAVYGLSGDGGTNCYFVTIEQCRAAVSGVGGFCEPNQFYDGRPVVTPGAEPAPRGKRARV